MCDYFFWQKMDSCADQGGDLADIVRSVAGAAPSTSSSDLTDTNSWQFPADPAASYFQQQLSTDDFAAAGDGFGLRDPLLNELAGAVFFDGGGGGEGSEKSGSDGGGSSSVAAVPRHQKLLIGDEMKRPCSNLFSRVLQISPAKPSPLSPRAIKPLPMVAGDMVKLDHGVQISSPRTPGIKRRKGQAKKVVCIPAPAPAAPSSRPSGEVVPSDLWAWRKYGQKPIKGSPYPRGYYRCSSSKGCSARKQVERSRTDPNMLVITYTSEHNHPWPTQRNALAGSTRSQPSKNSSASSAAKSSSLHHSNSQRQPTPNLKEEPRESTTTTTSCPSLPMVKEELVGEIENVDAMPMVNDNAFDDVFYNEAVMADNQPDDYFFADLAKLEPDPMSLIFSRPEFDGEKSDEEGKESNRGMDPFINMFDWAGSTFGDHQSKKGL